MKLSFRGRELASFDASAVAIETESLSQKGGGGPALKVISLDISNNSIPLIAGGFALPYLVELNASNNVIHTLRTSLPASLTRLHLAHNLLTSLSGLEECTSLSYLDVSHNKLVSVDAVLPTSLQTLNISHNSITSIENVTAACRLMKILVDNNKLAHLQDVAPLGSLRALRHLTIDGNPVSENRKLFAVLTGSIPKLTTLDGSTLSQAQANRMFKAAEAVQRSKRAALSASTMSLNRTVSRTERRDVEDVEEVELRRLEARVRELERIAKEAHEQEVRVDKDARLKRQQLTRTAEIIDEQERQLQALRELNQEASAEHAALTNVVESLDRTFRTQHTSLLASKLR